MWNGEDLILRRVRVGLALTEATDGARDSFLLRNSGGKRTGRQRQTEKERERALCVILYSTYSMRRKSTFLSSSSLSSLQYSLRLLTWPRPLCTCGCGCGCGFYSTLSGMHTRTRTRTRTPQTVEGRQGQGKAEWNPTAVLCGAMLRSGTSVRWEG